MESQSSKGLSQMRVGLISAGTIRLPASPLVNHASTEDRVLSDHAVEESIQVRTKELTETKDEGPCPNTPDETGNFSSRHLVEHPLEDYSHSVESEE